MKMFLFFTILALTGSTSAVRFYIYPGQRRCFTTDMQTDSKISGEATVTGGKGDMEIDLWVTTLKGEVLLHKRSPNPGKFTFYTPTPPRGHYDDDDDDYDYYNSVDEDTFRICIEHQQNPSRANAPDVKRAVRLQIGNSPTQDSAATVSDTERLQTRMRQMHTTLAGIIGDLSVLERRERALAKSVTHTAGRVTTLSLFAIMVALTTSAVQFRYYRGYFKQKKIC